MGTRSDIIVHRADGKWHRIYCHWDGYLSHNGQILFDHYTGQKKVESLVSPGDLSVLAARCTKPKGHSFDKAVKGYCIYYGRDRDESDVAGTIGDTLFAVWPEQDTWTEFTYVWCDAQIGEKPQDPCWWVADPDKGTQDLVNLGDALQGKISVKPAIKAFGMVLGQHAPHDPFKAVR